MNTRMQSYPASTTQTGLTATTLAINKIVVVGHPLSGYEGVESLLIRCGMQAAAPSQREGLSAADIGATLLKAHRVIPLDPLQTQGPIQPLQPGPIWQSLALDLLLGNINHDLWGWSDPQAVYLLDYWKNLDPQLAFMLVYDTPQDLIARAFDNPEVECTPEALQTAVGNWQAYNEALLHFYHRNPQRCMLVHAAQVRESAADYLEQVQVRIGAPLGSTSEAKVGGAMAPVSPDTENALRRYLAQHILGAHPQALTLYEELQAVASLPHSASTTTDQEPHAARQALAALQTLRQAAASRDPQAQSGEFQQENDLLLAQLHQVQEELERYYLENQRLKSQASAAIESAPVPAPYGAAERVKQQLSYQLGSKMIEHSRGLGGWLGMPFALISVARQYKRELPQRKAAKQMPIEKYRDAYEAERVKQHLSYRLGAAMVANARTPLGWMMMPWKLRRAALDFKRSRLKK